VLMYMGIFALLIGVLVSIPVATLSYIIYYNKLVKRLK